MKKFVFIFALFLISYFVADAIYSQTTKTTKEAKSKRVECFEKTTTFEKVFEQDGIEALKNSILASNVTFNYTFKKSHFMKSKLFDHVAPKQIEEYFDKAIEKIKKAEIKSSKLTTVDVLVYENDKDDPGKKSPKAKLYTGYFTLSFKQDNVLIYKIQIDFLEPKGADMASKIECMFKAIESL